MKKEIRFKLRILAGVLLVLALIMGVRLYFLQVVHGESYREIANRQYVRKSDRLYTRGEIIFTTKDNSYISAASTAHGFTIAVAPKSLPEDVSPYGALAQLLAIPESIFTTLDREDTYEVLSRRVDKDTAEQISQLELPAVFVEREQWRVYPSKNLASHAIGFVGFDEENLVTGRSGLELFYNNNLERSDNGLFTNSFAELFSNVNSLTKKVEEGVEGDIVTSLEPTVSQKLDAVLKDVHTRYASSESGGIIMDPHTGEVLAMIAYPNFDPNDIQQADTNVLQNPLVEKRYEFGSIVKPLTVASAIDSGALSIDASYEDTGCVTLDTEEICNYDKRARGHVALQEVLSQSLNVVIAHITGRMSHATQRSYFESLGLGDVTGIDVSGEISGTLASIADTDRSIEYATAGYGQGIAQTPIGMITALSTLANNGVRVRPSIAQKLRLTTGISRTLHQAEETTVFKQETVDSVSQMLTKVVDTALVGGTLKLDHTRVAAKTGTAQIADSSGSYDPDKFMHSIFGYFPAEDPRFILLLYTRAPVGVEYASNTLAEPLMELVQFLVQYYAIPPDR